MNCFLFCKKHGLFNGFIFLTIKKFLLSYFPNFIVSVRGENLSISYLKQSCFSHGDGSVKDRTYQEKEKLATVGSSHSRDKLFRSFIATPLLPK